MQLYKIKCKHKPKAKNLILQIKHMFSFFKLTERELFLNWNNPVWKAQLTNCTEKKPQAPQSQIQPDYGQITTRPPKVKLLCVFSRHSELLSRGLIKVLAPRGAQQARPLFIDSSLQLPFIQTRLHLMVKRCITHTSIQNHHGVL